MLVVTSCSWIWVCLGSKKTLLTGITNQTATPAPKRKKHPSKFWVSYVLLDALIIRNNSFLLYVCYCKLMPCLVHWNGMKFWVFVFLFFNKYNVMISSVHYRCYINFIVIYMSNLNKQLYTLGFSRENGMAIPLR